jgi:hypothetical protein
MTKVTKKTAEKTKEQTEPPKEAPSLTFTEEEAGKLASFLNFAFKHACWKELSTQEVFHLQQHFAFMKTHLEKVEGHIMDHPRLIDTKGK